MNIIKTGCPLLLLWLITLTGLRAQSSDPDRPLLLLPSPKGNYLVIAPMQPTAADSVLQQQTAYFQIERVELTLRLLEKGQTKANKVGGDRKSPDDQTLNTREITRLRRPNTLQDLRRVVTADYLTLLREATKQATDEDLIRFVQTHTNPNSYGLVGATMDLQLVLGNVYIDADVTVGAAYYYRIFRVDQAGQRTFWSEGTTVAGADNATLKQLQVHGMQVSAIDSVVQMSWALPVNQFVTPLPVVPSSPVDLSDLTFIKSLAAHITTPESVKGVLMVYNGTEWKQAETLMPSLNVKGDSLLFYWTKSCLPEDVVRAYIVPQDIVANPGTPSDTLTAVAISSQRLVLIYGASARDTTDAVRLSWDRLPAKPYYTGVEVTRDNGSDSTFSVVARLTPQDSVYYDYKVRPGISFTYRVRPIFIPLQGLEQITPAEAVGSCTKFSKPLPVSELQVVNEGRHIRVNWTGTDSPSLYGYYVYRGTSKTNLSVISPTIARGATTYLDTVEALSGRTEYFYSVMATNVRQDTSLLVAPVGIRPLRSIETTYPRNVEVSLVNKAAWLSWNDVRQEDNILTGFILQKQTRPNGPFSSVSATVLTEPSYIDTTLRAGQTVWYRIGAVTAFGDTTAFSEPAELSVPRPAPDPVFTFYVRNLTEGIEVSWPGISNGLREKYGIYRREAESEDFTKIGEVDQRGTLYVDTKVQNGAKYVYSVTAIEADNRESKRVKSEAIVRE